MAFKWTVSGHLGDFRQGEKLDTPEKVGDYFRAYLSEGNDVTIRADQLSDATIWSKLSEKFPVGGPDNPDESSDAEIEVVSALEEAIDG